MSLIFYALGVALFILSIATLQDFAQSLGWWGLSALCLACAYGYHDYQSHLQGRGER